MTSSGLSGIPRQPNGFAKVGESAVKLALAQPGPAAVVESQGVVWRQTDGRVAVLQGAVVLAEVIQGRGTRQKAPQRRRIEAQHLNLNTLWRPIRL